MNAEDQLELLKAQIADLEAQLEAKREDGKRFLYVTNLTPNFVSLPHPSGEDARVRVLGPYEARLLDPALANSEFVIAAKKRGFIKFIPADPDDVDADGRAEALEDILEDTRQEATAVQFLFYPGDDLSHRTDRGKTNSPHLESGVIAYILWGHIHVVPRVGGPSGRVDVEYLRYSHTAFLNSVLRREKLWRKRAGIMKPIEDRLAEIEKINNQGVIPSLGKEIRSDGPTL